MREQEKKTSGSSREISFKNALFSILIPAAALGAFLLPTALLCLVWCLPAILKPGEALGIWAGWFEALGAWGLIAAVVFLLCAGFAFSVFCVDFLIKLKDGTKQKTQRDLERLK